MAGSLNRATLIGHVGKDPEIRSVNSGKVANFSVATSETWRDKNSGEKKESTQWHSIVVWNENLVKIVEQYVKKGDKIMVEGQIQTRKWTDKDGNDRYTTEIVLSGFNGSILLLSNKSQDQNQNANRAGNSAREEGPVGGGNVNYSSELADEIPFIYEWR